MSNHLPGGNPFLMSSASFADVGRYAPGGRNTPFIARKSFVQMNIANALTAGSCTPFCPNCQLFMIWGCAFWTAGVRSLCHYQLYISSVNQTGISESQVHTPFPIQQHVIRISADQHFRNILNESKPYTTILIRKITSELQLLRSIASQLEMGMTGKPAALWYRGVPVWYCIAADRRRWWRIQSARRLHLSRSPWWQAPSHPACGHHSNSTASSQGGRFWMSRVNMLSM